MANPVITRDDANSKMTVKDRLMLALIARGEAEVHFGSITDFATSVDMTRSTAYQGLYALQKQNALEIITEKQAHGPNKVIGVILQRIPTAHEIVNKAIHNTMGEARAARAVNRSINKVNANIPNTLGYLEKKVVLDNIRAQVAEAGYNPDEVLNLPATDVWADEACYLYNELCAAQRQIVELEANANLAQRLPEPIAIALGEPVLA